MFISLLGLLGCNAPNEEINPLLTEWDTPFGVPPFDTIKVEHFEPAIGQGMALQLEEIAAITSNPEPPTFANSVAALDASGSLLRRVRNVFSGLNGAVTNEEMQTVAQNIAPPLSQHSDAILLDEALFARIDAVHEQREQLDLTPEQMRLLTETHKRFVRGGANLASGDKESLKGINEELAVLSLQFGENVLKETNRFELVLTAEAGLAGLPDGVITAAREAAEQRDLAEGWVFTIHKPSLIPFLQYSEHRDLREQMLRAYIDVGNHGDELDNNQTLVKQANLRVERAHLLGYPSHAHYVLANNMAKEPDQVYGLLQQIWPAALARAKGEAAEMQAMVDAEFQARGEEPFTLQPWDWWYYAEKVKKAKFDLDEEMLRPYFELEKVRTGMFEVAQKLFGITLTERPDLPVYHPDVKAFEVNDADGAHLAILFVDYFPRESKRGGAWMNSFRKQFRSEGDRVAPLVFNVGNFTKPTGDTPSLLSVDEVKTMYHEFGHGLHGMLSDCAYRTLSGTSVKRDFVELPAQIMENWALSPEVLNLYARHYRTGEAIPVELIEKMERSKHFNQGFATVEYLAACFLDMDWHTLTEPTAMDAAAFEKRSMDGIGLIDEIVVRYRSPYFRHIFAGGYSAGYYAYVWAEVLDADAFEAFKETGDLFDQATARSFRENILAKGNSADPMDLYRTFRGSEPGIDPYLARHGLN